MSKLIVVTGNNGAGKTVFSYLLANRLTAKGKRAMLVNTNNSSPDFPFLLPTEKNKDVVKSLGRVLSLAVISKTDILSNMLPMHNEDLCALCYGREETKYSYPNISKVNIESFFDILKDTVDYVIVDSQAIKNDIDIFAVATADVRLCITTADYKGLAYRQSLEDGFIQLLYNNSKFNPYEDIRSTFADSVKYEIPHFQTIGLVYNGLYIDELLCPKRYGKLLDRIILEEINCEQ